MRGIKILAAYKEGVQLFDFGINQYAKWKETIYVIIFEE